MQQLDVEPDFQIRVSAQAEHANTKMVMAIIMRSLFEAGFSNVVVEETSLGEKDTLNFTLMDVLRAKEGELFTKTVLLTNYGEGQVDEPVESARKHPFGFSTPLEAP